MTGQMEETGKEADAYLPLFQSLPSAQSQSSHLSTVGVAAEKWVSLAVSCTGRVARPSLTTLLSPSGEVAAGQFVLSVSP